MELPRTIALLLFTSKMCKTREFECGAYYSHQETFVTCMLVVTVSDGCFCFFPIQRMMADHVGCYKPMAVVLTLSEEAVRPDGSGRRS